MPDAPKSTGETPQGEGQNGKQLTGPGVGAAQPVAQGGGQNGEQPTGVPVPRWCTRFGGVYSIPVVILGVLLSAAVSLFVVNLLNYAKLRIGDTYFTPRLEIYAFSVVSVMLSLWLVLSQAFSYINHGQAQKIEFIRGFFPPDIIARYFDQFWSGRPQADAASLEFAKSPSADAEAKLTKEFMALLAENFGMSAYVLPAVLFAVVASIVLFIGFAGGLSFAEHLTTNSYPVAPLGLRIDLVSIAAIFGAFTYIASDAITRNHQWTFHASDLSWYSLRLVFAVPLGQAIALTWTGGATGSNGVGPATGAFLAFVVSMFSFESITAMLSSVAAKTGTVPSSAPVDKNDVILSLAGVDQENARSLAVEGITTVSQLVAVDPIRTSIRTGLPFEYVVKLIDAALLWDYLVSDVGSLRPFGFRGATDVLSYIEEQRTATSSSSAGGAPPPTTPGAAPDMDSLLVAIAGKTKIDPVGLRNVFARIGVDPYVDFVLRMYNAGEQTYNLGKA